MHLLVVAPIGSHPEVLALGRSRRGVLHLHGARLGRLHLRDQRHRRARAALGGPGPLQLRSAQGLHAPVCHRHGRRYSDPRGRLAAHPVVGADRAPPGLPWLPVAGLLRLRPPEQADVAEGLRHLPRQDVRRLPRGFGDHVHAALPHGLLRAAVGPHSRPLREAHQDRESACGLRRGAPPRQRRHLRQLSQPAPRLRLPRRCGVLVPAHQRVLVRCDLRGCGHPLLGQDVAVGPHLCADLHGRLCDLVWLPPRLHHAASLAVVGEGWLQGGCGRRCRGRGS
mmetsp:Transcript_99686/g.279199  ORF Transcript_99686/g.279199 Transcript_99686/m.279199 type:complete len:281 (-) Transcript_99686:1046-1888(-)